MTVNFAGNVYDDAGNAVSGASVKLLETGTTTQEGSTVTTDSNGAWAFTESDQDRYDVEITKGTSVRRIKWSDQISFKELDVRNNSAAGTPAGTFTNLANSASNQVAVFSGANSTRADNDEIYLSFKFANSAGDIEEFARMTAVATDVTDGSEDGQFEFDVMQAGSLIKAFTIASSTSGAQSIDFNQDAITFGTGTAATDITLTFDAESADGVITWMEDEDYFKFSDDILINGTERINFYDTAIYIYSSTDGQLDLIADTEIQIAATTIDINGAVALDGAITGATNITLSGELDAATLDISGNADIDGTLEADAYTVDGVTLAEYISDTTGAMFSSNTETGLSATYQDGDNTIDLAIAAAQTTITSLFATDIKIGEDDQTKIDFEDANTINFYANNAKEVVLAENSISPGTSDGTALGTTSLMWSDLFLASGSVINFNNGDITLTHSSNTLTAAGGTVATAALTTSTIVASGIVKTDDTTNATSTTDGSLQTDGGLSVVLDAVFGDDVKLLSDSAVLAFGADGDATLTHTDDTGITLNSTNKLMFNDASQFVQGSSATVLSIGATDEIDLTATAVDLNGTLNVSGATVFQTSIDITGSAGIILENDETITNSTNGLISLSGNLAVPDGGTVGSASDTDAMTIASGGNVTFSQDVVLGDGSSVNISTPLLAGADHTYSGVTATMLAGGTIAAFDLVCINTTTQEVVEADASAYATARVIGIAPAAISDEASGTVLLHGFIRDDTWNWTTGSTLYLSETAGAMTHTAPTTDGAFVQVVGVALEPDVVYFNPSMDVIEHA